jgi:hypothetical protein
MRIFTLICCAIVCFPIAPVTVIRAFLGAIDARS